MKKKLVKDILQYVAIGLLGIFLIFNIWNFIDIKSGFKAPIFGHRSFNIVSNSMSVVDESNKERLTGITDQFKKGDLVHTTTNFKYEDLKENKIVTFQKDGLIYCHRIVKLEVRSGVKGCITQGDANAVSDGFIKFEQINGIVTSISKGIGNFVGFITSGYFTIAIFVAAAFITGGILIIDYGNYHQFNILEDHQNNLYEDETIFLNPSEYSLAKGKTKKAYKLEKADNHYVLSVSGKTFVLTRYIRTDYKIDEKLVSGEFKGKSLEETTLSSTLEYIEQSNKPIELKKITRKLHTKGIILDEKSLSEVKKALEKKR